MAEIIIGLRHQQREQDDDILQEVDEPGPEESAGFDHGFCKEPADEAGHEYTGDAGGVAEIMNDPENESGHGLNDEVAGAFIQPNANEGKAEENLLDERIIKGEEDHEQQSREDIDRKRALPEDLEEDDNGGNKSDDNGKIEPKPLPAFPLFGFDADPGFGRDGAIKLAQGEERKSAAAGDHRDDEHDDSSQDEGGELVVEDGVVLRVFEWR